MVSRVLVVDGDEAAVEALEAALRQAHLEPISALDAVTAVKLFDELGPAVVLIGVQAHGLDAKALARTLRARSAQVPLLFMGRGASDDPIRAPSEALDAGGDYYFRLPTDLGYLAGRVRGWAYTGAAEPGLPDNRHEELYALSAELDGDLDLEGLNENASEHPENPALAALRSTSQRPPSVQHAPAPGLIAHPAPQPRPDTPKLTPSIDTARSLVREAEALRNAGRIDEAIEAYQAAASMYSQDGEVRPALALYKLLLYLDPTRLELAYEGAIFAARHAQMSDARALVDRSAKALEQASRVPDALDLVLRFVEQAGPDPHLMALRRRLESLIPTSSDAPWASAVDEAVEEQRRLLERPPPPMLEVANPGSGGFRDGSTLDLIGLEARPSDDLYPDTRELGHPATTDLAATAILDIRVDDDDDDLIFEEPVEVPQPPVETEPTAVNHEFDGIVSAAAHLAAFRDAPKPPVLGHAGPSEPPALALGGPSEPNPLLTPAGHGDPNLKPITVGRSDEGLAFQFPSADVIPKTSPVLEGTPAMIAVAHHEPAQAWRPPALDELPPETQEFESKTEEVDLNEIAELSAIQSARLETQEVPLFDDDQTPFLDVAVPLTRSAPPDDAVTPHIYPPTEDFYQPTEELRFDDEPMAIPSLAPPNTSHSDPSPPPAREPSFSQGSVGDLQDALEVLGELYATEATGVLRSPTAQLVIVDGQPCGVCGRLACEDLLNEAQQGHPLPAEPLPAELDESNSPVAVARYLVERGVMSETESNALLHHQLEAALQTWLTSSGPWQFRSGDVRPQDMLMGLPDVRRTLIDLLDAAPDGDAVLDRELIVRSGNRDPHMLGERDDRFAALLDGQHSIAEAARMVGLPTARAVAVAIVLLGFRLGVVVGRARSGRRPLRRAGSRSAGVGAALASFPSRLPSSAPGPHDALSTLPAPARIRALAEMVRSSDYFTMLGVGEDASRDDIDEAHVRLRGMVPSATEHNDPSADPLVREVIRSLDEARDVLKVPELRAAYLSHLRR